MQKTITFIAAMGKNRAIGLNGQMPWHLPAELQHFKRATMGKTIVMGRKTWQAIGRPLPGRQNIIISRNAGFVARGAVVRASFESAVNAAQSNEIMVIGGGQLYALALPFAQRMLLTLVDLEPEADTWFPAWDAEDWCQQQTHSYAADDKCAPAYRIVELTRTFHLEKCTVFQP